MGKRKEIDGSLGVPEFYGKELRWQRETAERTLQETVEGSFYSVSFLSEIERGKRRMPLDLALHVDRLFKTDGFFKRHCEDVRRSWKNAVAKYAEALALEEKAAEIEQWQSMMIPGPLQLEPYIRAVVRAAPFEQEAVTAMKVDTRRERGWLLESTSGPEEWVVMHESILRQPIISAEDMAVQLDHVAAAARRRGFIPQILPCNAGAHPLMMGHLWLMNFDDAPPIMYTESTYSGQIIEDPALVKQYTKAYERLRATALPPDVSLKMIEKAAEDYGNGIVPPNSACPPAS